MSDTFFVEPRENRADAVDGFVRLLDAYANAVLRFRDDPKLLYGSAVNMRKTAEAIGAYLWYYVCEGPAIPHGKDLMEKSRKMIGTGLALRQANIWDDFLSYRDNLIANDNNARGVNFLMHYQPLFDEKEALEEGFRLFYKRLREYRELIRFFFDAVPEIRSRVSERGTPALFRLDTLDLFAMQETVDAAIAYIETLYRSRGGETDCWLEWHCSLLNRYTGIDGLAETDLMAVVSRNITERRLRQYLSEKQIRVPDVNDAKDTMEDLLGRLKHVTKDNLQADLYDYGRIVRDRANRIEHWSDGEWSRTIPNEMRGRSYSTFQRDQKNLCHACAQIVSTCSHPGEEAQEWIRRTADTEGVARAELEKAREKAAAEKKRAEAEARERAAAQQQLKQTANEKAALETRYYSYAKALKQYKAALDTVRRQKNETEQQHQAELREKERRLREVEEQLREMEEQLEAKDTELAEREKQLYDSEAEDAELAERKQQLYDSEAYDEFFDIHDILNAFHDGASDAKPSGQQDLCHFPGDEDEDIFERALQRSSSGTTRRNTTQSKRSSVFDEDEDFFGDDEDDDRYDMYLHGYYAPSEIRFFNWLSILLNLVSFPLVLAGLFLTKGNPWLRNIDSLHIASVALGLLLWLPLGISEALQIFTYFYSGKCKIKYVEWTLFETVLALTLLLCTAILIVAGSQSGPAWARAGLIAEYIELFMVPFLAGRKIKRR